VEEGFGSGADCANDDLARGGDFWLWTAVSRAGIFDRLGVGASQRPVAGGHSEYHRDVDDADGRAVLGDAFVGTRAAHAVGFGSRFGGDGSGDLSVHSAAVDELASRLVALALGVLLACGFVLQSDEARRREGTVFFLAGAAGLGLVAASRWLDAQPIRLYAVYDYWHTSPQFFLIRVGMLLAILTASYAWCRWGAGQWSFSPPIELGKASLLVYWVHLEFVYGRLSILPKHRLDIWRASEGLMVIFLAMLMLAVLRTRLKGRGGEVLAWVRDPAAAH
jgi:hypothetical protein